MRTGAWIRCLQAVVNTKFPPQPVGIGSSASSAWSSVPSSAWAKQQTASKHAAKIEIKQFRARMKGLTKAKAAPASERGNILNSGSRPQHLHSTRPEVAGVLLFLFFVLYHSCFHPAFSFLLGGQKVRKALFPPARLVQEQLQVFTVLSFQTIEQSAFTHASGCISLKFHNMVFAGHAILVRDCTHSREIFTISDPTAVSVVFGPRQQHNIMVSPKFLSFPIVSQMNSLSSSRLSC